MRNVIKLVIVVVVAGVGYFIYKGGVKVSKDGVAIDKSKMSAPDVEANPYAKGQFHWQTLNWDKCLAAYRKALKEDPKNEAAPVAAYRVANCLEKLKKSSEALAAYRSFLKKYPSHELNKKARKHITELELM